MSRVPLRDSTPTLQQAQLQLNTDRTAFLAARTTRDTAKDTWETLLGDPTALQPTITAAQQTYRQANQVFDAARLTYSQSIDACGTAQDRVDL